MDYSFRYDCPLEAVESLQPEVLAAFEKVAGEYHAATGDMLTVTSGRRSLRKMAELMAKFSMEQLEGMYCRNGYPQYILAIKEARAFGDVDAEKTYGILQNRTEGYISMHLSGGAVDIATEGMKEQETLTSLLEKHGFTAFNETELGVGCIHASFKTAQKLIIRE